MASEILNPVITVKVRGEQIEVRELTWKDYIRAIKELSGSLLKLVSDGGNAVSLTKENVLEALSSQEDLVQWVTEKSTGREAEWVKGLGGKDMVFILAAIVELNLSDELVASGKDLAGRMGKVFGLRNLSLAPSITSSAPATPSETSKR